MFGVALVLPRSDTFGYQNDGRANCNYNHSIFYVFQAVIYQITGKSTYCCSCRPHLIMYFIVLCSNSLIRLSYDLLNPLLNESVVIGARITHSSTQNRVHTNTFLQLVASFPQVKLGNQKPVLKHSSPWFCHNSWWPCLPQLTGGYRKPCFPALRNHYYCCACHYRRYYSWPLPTN